MISHLSGGEAGRGFSEEGGETLAQEAVGKASGKLREGQQGMAQRLDLGIGKAQRRGALLVHLAGMMQLLEALFGEHTVVADFLDFE